MHTSQAKVRRTRHGVAGRAAKSDAAIAPPTALAGTETVAQRRQAAALNAGPGVRRLQRIQGKLANGSAVLPRADLGEGQNTAQLKPVAQRSGAAAATGTSGTVSAGTGGLPAALRSGAETLSGEDLGDVKVHVNSARPTRINALAYTQGNDIYLGAGQERHLSHEVWHVVQQRQGRVRATTQFAGTAINDSPALEREADVMGRRALVVSQRATGRLVRERSGSAVGSGIAQAKIVLEAFPGASALVQLKIQYDTATKQFYTDGKRAKWRAFLKRSTATEAGVSATTSFSSLGLDRAHRIPYAALETLVADYCNGDASYAELVDLTNSLYDTWSDEYEAMDAARTDLIDSDPGTGTPSIVRLYANALLSLLNSATRNVSPGGASENRGIQDRIDYGYMQSPGGSSVVLTPRSQRVHDAWSRYGREPEAPMTPGGVHVRSSQQSSLQFGGTKVKLFDVRWSGSGGTAGTGASSSSSGFGGT